MSKSDQEISGFIIKSQDLGEADLLLTFFSETEGKIRALVKSAKKMTSKLSGHLQPYILVQVTLVGDGSLPKVISVQPLVKYQQIIENQQGMHAMLAMQELVLRALADAQPNPDLFAIYHQALSELSESRPAIFVLTKFYALALLTLGFAPRLLENNSGQTIFFSIQNGKFLTQMEDSGDQGVSVKAYQLIEQLLNQEFDPIDPEDFDSSIELLALLTKFASYQLERDLRAPLYFTVV